ncbi:class I SAM-dependent methyltransferase [Aggregicoccus sp. 17bor-14]|nr:MULTISPECIES: class I SAM-dependent methyltransferase [Myxococcaceae]MBF5041792.1 class I SAM-dependent methyltransferase [Simulacricoccus sp. 17bor-14]MRI87573.1 class I SAM-dependent methyltransferase [Aggregicoccus sp. 17bor-14]
MGLPGRDLALVALGEALRAQGYRHITVTPETHRRVNARPDNAQARDLRGVFGWSRPFASGLLPAPLERLLEEAGELRREPGGLLRSGVRFSSLGRALFVHDAWPTLSEDSVFFGPDTYRFAAQLARLPGSFGRAVDVGCGSGAGGLSLDGRVARLLLADVSGRALRFAGVNAALNGQQDAACVHSDVLDGVEGDFDLIAANPPYIVDTEGRTYRDGGGLYGAELSVRIVRESLPRLARGGTLLLYTGAPVVDGEDVLLRALEPLLGAHDVEARYEETDPDVFGEELEKPEYDPVERIAVAVLTVRRP